MKKLIAIASCLLLCVGVVMARPRQQSVKVVLTGAAVYAGTNTTASVNGYIDEIVVSCSDGASTGVVAVTVSPLAGDAVSIATGTVTDEKRWRPRVDSTTVAGAANTGNDPIRFPVVGETINVEVTASESSNVTWRADIKYDDGK